MLDFDYEASWATAPQFYRAPHPANMHARDYQHAGVEYHLARDHALFGDAPGVGKTAECILLDNAIESRRTLVICPASLRLNWEREIWAWSMRPNVGTYPVLGSADGISPEADFNIISYSLLANKSILEALLDLRWDHVILDEAHALKDPKGNTRSKAICGWNDYGTYRKGICDVAGRMTLASGTILPNQPIEAYNAIRLLNPEAINNASLESFREYYYDFGGGMIRGRVFDAKRGIWVNKLHYEKNVRNKPIREADLQQRMRKYIMVRRLKQDVLAELPPKTWHPFPLATTPAMRAALKHPGWAEAERLYEMDHEAFDHGVPIDGAVSTARRELGEAKAPAVADYIEELLEEGVNKLVVGAFHSSVLAILRERLSKYGLAYMDGGTSARKRQAEVDRFQVDERVRVMLGQEYVLGEGWTLTAAQDAVLAEPDWVPGRNDQFLDRIHRFGQKGDAVIGHVPVVPGTLDERLLGIAIEKDKHIYRALDERLSK